MVADFDWDLIRMRTREGMKVARASGRLRGKQPKPSPRQEAHLVALRHARPGTRTSAELAELFSVARSTVYRARSSVPAPAQPRVGGLMCPLVTGTRALGHQSSGRSERFGCRWLAAPASRAVQEALDPDGGVVA